MPFIKNNLLAATANTQLGEISTGESNVEKKNEWLKLDDSWLFNTKTNLYHHIATSTYYTRNDNNEYIQCVANTNSNISLCSIQNAAAPNSTDTTSIPLAKKLKTGDANNGIIAKTTGNLMNSSSSKFAINNGSSEKMFSSLPAIKISASARFMQGRRPKQEDRHVCIDNLYDIMNEEQKIAFKNIFNCNPASFYGLFDGHSGTLASEFCSNVLPKNIILLLLKTNQTKSNTQNASASSCTFSSSTVSDLQTECTANNCNSTSAASSTCTISSTTAFSTSFNTASSSLTSCVTSTSSVSTFSNTSTTSITSTPATAYSATTFPSSATTFSPSATTSSPSATTSSPSATASPSATTSPSATASTTAISSAATTTTSSLPMYTSSSTSPSSSFSCSTTNSEEKVGSMPLKEVVERLKAAFLRTDREFLTKYRLARDGCTAVHTLVLGKYAFMATLGDSRCLIATNVFDDNTSRYILKSERATEDHKPSREDEKKRIEEAGGKVVYVHGVARVATHDYQEKAKRIKMETCLQGGAAIRPPTLLAVSRAFGDRELKEGKLLIATPEICIKKLTKNEKFVVMACDGIWDVLSDQDVIEITKMHMGNPTEASSAIVKKAFEKKSQDNLTAVVIFFDGVNNDMV